MIQNLTPLTNDVFNKYRKVADICKLGTYETCWHFFDNGRHLKQDLEGESKKKNDWPLKVWQFSSKICKLCHCTILSCMHLFRCHPLSEKCQQVLYFQGLENFSIFFLFIEDIISFNCVLIRKNWINPSGVSKTVGQEKFETFHNIHTYIFNVFASKQTCKYIKLYSMTIE